MLYMSFFLSSKLLNNIGSDNYETDFNILLKYWNKYKINTKRDTLTIDLLDQNFHN